MPKKEEKLTEEETQDIAEQPAEPSVEEVESVEPAVNEEVPDVAAESEAVLEEEKIDSVVEESTVSVGQDSITDGTVTVQPIQFASFEDSSQTQGEVNKNLDILMDIKLQLTVELGRTELPIRKVLELTRGSIIELEKVAGEPVELYANGKLVAHGEVVVIEDNFGLRITSITDPEDRLRGI